MIKKIVLLYKTSQNKKLNLRKNKIFLTKIFTILLHLYLNKIMNSHFHPEQDPGLNKGPAINSEVGKTENESQQSTELKVENEDKKDNLYLNIRFTNSCSIPILIDSLSPAGKIIHILSDSLYFQNKPLLLFKGKLLDQFISLKAQGVKNKDEIVIYEKVINSFLSITNQTNPFNNDLLNNLKKNQSVCPDFQTTPFEQKIFSILNEVNRLEDLANNIEGIESENSLYIDTDDESDDDEEEYETDDFFNEENESNDSSYSTNLQKSSLISILNPINKNENSSFSIKPAKTMKVKMLTVLGPESKEVSTQPLPTCFQSQNRMSSKNNAMINCPSFKSFEDASRFFANNSSTYWKW